MEGIMQFAPIILMVAVFYFFFIRPQAKKQKEEVNFGKNIKKGDKVVTKSGLHGRIAEVHEKDNTCTIETSAGKIKFERSALSLELSKKLQA